MAHLVPISEAKDRLSELVRDSADENVILMRHGHPTAVLVSTEYLQSLLDDLEDAEDRLSIYEREHDAIPWEQARKELALD